ncbi:MAG: hypothetical protein FWF44_09685, partial [Defluviitaleaceae bacterium]|nr:hypothetical protein [Defluviitaleaceae bacterium]
TSGGTVEALGVDFGIGFYLDTLSGAPMNTMDKIKCPVLFLQGANDNPCRCADAKLAYDLMKRAGLRADYTELPGGEHTLDNMPEETAAIAMAWVKQII